VQYIVDDGCHVKAGQAYCEIEVMKMVMSLTACDSGTITYLHRPGAVLSAGTVIGKLTLDNPDNIRMPTAYEGQLVEPIRSGATSNVQGALGAAIGPGAAPADKLHNTYKQLVGHLKNVLNGYALPDPVFTADLRASVDRLFVVLKDPKLPLLELQEIMSVISGRIPAELEQRIRTHMVSYANNITSVLSKFPSQAIAAEVDRYTANLSKPDRDMFFMTAAAIMQLVQRYRGGTKGHMRIVVEELLRCYLRTEQNFLTHQYDKCVMLMRENIKDMNQVN
jgi:acetyl-CoA carboxylase/biotin carboxylase 1